MDIKEKAKKELEDRIQSIENLIAKKGFGSKQLARAERLQRNVNIGVFLGTLTTVAGIAAYLFAGKK